MANHFLLRDYLEITSVQFLGLHEGLIGFTVQVISPSPRAPKGTRGTGTMTYSL